MPKPVPVRFTIDHPAAVEVQSNFADDVRSGLTANPKSLPPKYFYDALGSQLFEAICLLPEYYPTRAETEIFTRHTAEITRRAPSPVTVIELGSGSSIKTRMLIEALLARQGELHYQPIDISPTILEQSAENLLGIYPGLRITALAADYTRGLNSIERQGVEKALVMFLGSNIGNYDPSEALNLLRGIRSVLRPGDAFLLGTDLRKPADILEAAYDDALGVTAAFNLNLLLRINQELGADFEVRNFRHRAVWNEAAGRVEMHLVSRRDQQVRIDDLGLTVDFREGETIHTENSYKFDAEQIARLAADSGFRHCRNWLDSENRFSCNLWIVE
ncbi:MAG: L-histidine N(alpha)-methyltransferase [Acidobacteriota bacterium]|nr:MAG: L-histidine N(alpha)-methyltransferase [Acidobacteriota bacterium]